MFVNRCNAFFSQHFLHFNQTLLAATSALRNCSGVPLAFPQRPAVRCTGSAPHLLSHPPCIYPDHLAHCTLNIRILHMMWLKPFAFADPSAQNVQRDVVEIPPILPRPVKCLLLHGAFPRPNQIPSLSAPSHTKHSFCPCVLRPFCPRLNHLCTCLLLPSAPCGELTRWRLDLIRFCMSKGYLPRQAPTNVYGY